MNDNNFTIRPWDGTELDLDRMMDILRDSQRLLDPAFLTTGAGFDRDRWAQAVQDQDTEWILLFASDGHAAGFAGWRLKPIQCHLHALFVASDYQRRGFGRAMLRYHWQAAKLREPAIECFTLHVREAAVWAQRLYLAEKYRFYQEGDEAGWPALRVWIDACRERGDWPLAPAKRLMYRHGNTM